MYTKNNKSAPAVDRISNELELFIHGTNFETMRTSMPLDLQPEVNRRSMLETTVSLKNNITELNDGVSSKILALNRTAANNGGSIYGGASVMEDVSDVDPMRHKITSVSERLARGFLDIASMQVVIGVNNERLGFELYDVFRKVSPVLVALSASSPYKYGKDGSLVDTKKSSRRISQYGDMCMYLPETMWKVHPDISSINQHKQYMRNAASKLVKTIKDGKIDCNWPELTKVRANGNGGYSYYPFKSLDPNDVFIFVRPRPDHYNIDNGGKSVMSIELRAMDMPTTVQRMHMLNSFVVGIANVASNELAAGKSMKSYSFMRPLKDSFEELANAAKWGLDSFVSGTKARTLATSLGEVAEEGLRLGGHNGQAKQLKATLGHVIRYGNDADVIREQKFSDATSLKSYLREKMTNGEAIQ